MTDSSELWDLAVKNTLASGQQLTASKEEFNSACDHIVQLLKDASLLLASGSHATAAFLSLTALEETAKVHMGKYRRSATPAKRSQDPLYNHRQKHLLSLGPTVAMGARLQAAIGEQRLNELMELGRNGAFVPLREASLYVERATSFAAPKDAIAPSLSRELLLLAVESFDDALVGYTNHTFELGAQSDAIFARWAGLTGA